MTDTATTERERSINGIAWFAALLHARERSDFTKAAEAQRELDRLEIAVKVKREWEVENVPACAT